MSEQIKCHVCGGTGTAMDARCYLCLGAGLVVTSQPTGSSMSYCIHCGGTGKGLTLLNPDDAQPTALDESFGEGPPTTAPGLTAEQVAEERSYAQGCLEMAMAVFGDISLDGIWPYRVFRLADECDRLRADRQRLAEENARLADYIKVPCGACGGYIRESDGTCDCEDNRRHPIANGQRTMQQENKRLAEEQDHAMNLLARIHRDGGHHTSAHGFAKSCQDAEIEWMRLADELIAAREENARLRADAKTQGDTILALADEVNSLRAAREADRKGEVT